MKLIQTYRESDNLVDWLQRLVGAVADVENFRDIGGTNNPAFQNNWANILDTGVAVNAVAFYKDPYGRVHIKGSADTGANGTTVFTLPEGYRPLETLTLVTTKLTGVIGVITIDTDGTVDSTVGNANGVSLNVSFRT